MEFEQFTDMIELIVEEGLETVVKSTTAACPDIMAKKDIECLLWSTIAKVATMRILAYVEPKGEA
jgi:hypothetical protein